MKINEKGRSMIEMLGVLAIIGVLSVGGIAGYSKAMAKFRVNKTIDQVTHIATNVRILFGSQKNYLDLGRCGSATDIKKGKTMLNSAKAIPDGMSDTSDTYFSNAYAGQMHICSGDRLGASDNKAFVLAFTDIPQEACIDLATQDWNAASGSGLVAIEVQGSNTTNTTTDLATFTALTTAGCGGSVTSGTGANQSTTSYQNAAGKAFICGQGVNSDPMKLVDATAACSGALNTLYFKFF